MSASPPIQRVALIPARGGSKRLPGKNIMNICGRPMLLWSLDAARAYGGFDRIVVSSDDPQTLAIAQDAGAEVQRRDDTLCGDDITLAEVAEDFIKTSPAPITRLCVLMPNCPLRNAEDIRQVETEMIEADAWAAMSMVSYGWRPVQWAKRRTSEGFFRPLDLPADTAEQEKAGNILCPSGAVRWVRCEPFMQTPTFAPDDLIGVELPWFRAIDIDYESDFREAELIFWAQANGYAFEHLEKALGFGGETQNMEHTSL